MLGIIIPYHSCFELLPYQLMNFKRHVKTNYKVFVVDNSLTLQTPHSDVEWIVCKTDGNPSQRHQSAINLGLQKAWDSCDSFLLFDNDMIFVDDFKLPSITFYLEQQRGNWKYGWLNLMFFRKNEDLRHFDFAICPDTGERTDSGGTFGTYLRSGKVCAQIQTLKFPDFSIWEEYQVQYFSLCQRYGIGCWYDIYAINGTRVFHFRALSNWTKYPEEFQREKKALILSHLEKSMQEADGTHISGERRRYLEESDRRAQRR